MIEDGPPPNANREGAGGGRHALDVGEPSPTYCASHPQVETYLRCSRCETPICPRCLVHTSVGARCRQCGRVSRLPSLDARPRDLALGLGAGLGVGLVGGMLISLPWLGFLYLLLVLCVGYLVGRAVSAAAPRRRAVSLAAIASGSALFGLAFGPLLVVAVEAPWVLFSALPLRLLAATFMDPSRLLMIGLAGLVAWYQVR